VSSARDPWEVLRALTASRIGLGSAGAALPTAAMLEFQIDHACARDAIWSPWDVASFAASLRGGAGVAEVQLAKSQVRDRAEYLKCPHLGRRLAPESRAALEAHARSAASAPDVALVVSNGLSSLAIERHGAALVTAIAARLAPLSLTLGPVVLVPDGRVALGDDVGEALGARLSIVLVGERPGLSSADGVGIYMTYAPSVGTTDERRNCISNVRTPGGLAYDAAAAKLAWLVEQALVRQLSGVALKDEAPALVLGSGPEPALLA
jgi:ethanolamine ammonia-lyase small subunit